MVYLGQESDLWRRHRVVIRQEEFQLEDAPCRALATALEQRDQITHLHMAIVMDRGC
jgi:hypothetical protein